MSSTRLIQWRMVHKPITVDGERVADGHVEYEMRVDGLEHTLLTMQPYRLGSNPGTVKGVNVWGWDGDLEHPTLTPSFLCTYSGSRDPLTRGIRLHLFLRGGKIDLCGDSTVTLDLAVA